MIDDDATQFSYFRDNELTQLAETNLIKNSDDSYKALEEGTLFLNKYRILKILGEGSFSLIYLLEANDASKKLLVAKEFFPKGFVTRNKNHEVILKTSLTDKEIENYQFMKDIFIGEAQNLVKVSSRTHPNVLNFFSLEENINNTMYLITDYEEGITLKDYLRKRKKEYKGKLNNEEIKYLLQGLLNGLEHIHNVTIYHQDIKLENILIRQDNTPLLLDFGATVILYDKKRKKYFNATTPRYAAPEQIELSQPPSIDQRSDIYGLGVLAYKLITDTFPPKASERLKALEEHHDDPYIPLEIQKTYGYDIILLKAVDKALHLLPEQRFQDAKEFKNALILKENIFNLLALTKILLGLLVPIIGLLLYFMWPTSQGTAKLNLKEKTYFVYSDGLKVPISEEKTILLSTGIHQLTFIKDGYVPYEVNTTIEANKITNITAELIPSTHLIQLSSTIDNAKFIVNNEPIKGNTFQGQYGEKYIIKTIALNHPTEVFESDYITLYHKHFRFYQKLKLKNQKVNIKINQPSNIGETVIKVNNKPIINNIFEAEDSKKYHIKIINPYFKVIDIEKSYKELVKSPIQTFTLKRGDGKIFIEGLFPDIKINLYQKNSKTEIDANIKYKKGIYIVHTKTNKSLYFTLSKSGYISKKTPTFSLKNNENLSQRYTLKKIITTTKPLSIITKPIVKTLHKLEPTRKVTKIVETKKIDKIKQTTILKPIIKKLSKLEPIKKMTKKVKTKKIDKIKQKSKKHKIVINPKRKKIYIAKHQAIKKIKSKTRHKKTIQRKYMKSSRLTWYCIANSNGRGNWSAKKRTRASAYNTALNKCHKRKRNCRISSCYLWSQ